MSINRVVLTGRLTKDVELRATPSGANVASFTVAVDGFGRDQNNNPVNQASFVNCVAWNQTAKFVTTYCKKGSLVALEGRLQTRSYDRKDGTKAYVVEVLVASLQSFDSKGSNNNETIKDYTEPANANDLVLADDDFSDLPF